MRGATCARVIAVSGSAKSESEPSERVTLADGGVKMLETFDKTPEPERCNAGHAVITRLYWLHPEIFSEHMHGSLRDGLRSRHIRARLLSAQCDKPS